jgi:hypothetical protein
MKGWIVTWDGTKEGAERRKIVAVFNYRFGVERVRDLVEELYIALKYDEQDKVAFAVKPKNNPHRAKVDEFSRVTCGHNPWLYARYVNNIRPTDDGYRWDEPNVQAMQQ